MKKHDKVSNMSLKDGVAHFVSSQQFYTSELLGTIFMQAPTHSTHASCPESARDCGEAEGTHASLEHWSLHVAMPNEHKQRCSLTLRGRPLLLCSWLLPAVR